jgi:hypothetical protein
VDICKAFVTILHSALKPCLERKGVRPPIVEFITKMYKDTRTKIRTKDNIRGRDQDPQRNKAG